MTRGEAITAIYGLFNAPHNADINIVYLNKVLDDLCKSHPEQEEWPEEPVGYIAGEVRPPQRTWVNATTWRGLTDEEISELIRATHNTGSFVRAIEAALKAKNT